MVGMMTLLVVSIATRELRQENTVERCRHCCMVHLVIDVIKSDNYCINDLSLCQDCKRRGVYYCFTPTGQRLDRVGGQARHVPLI